MAKFNKVIEQDDGWSDWQHPKMLGYKMACCDCGLVHDIEFQAIHVTKKYDDGSYEYEELPQDEIRVRFKARRNNRSTGQLRRHMKANAMDESRAVASTPPSNC